MTPTAGKPYRWLALALAATAFAIGCGGGGAADEVGGGVAKAIGVGSDEALRGGTAFGDDGSRAFQSLTTPARRAAVQAGTSSDTEAQRVADAVYDAFCQGWDIYKSTGGFPSGDQWAGIAVDHVESVAIPTRAIVVQAVSAYQNAEYAYETGNVAVAQLDLVCSLR